MLEQIDPSHVIEEGFKAYSRGKVIPPVEELLLEESPGDVHIEYSYIVGD